MGHGQRPRSIRSNTLPQCLAPLQCRSPQAEGLLVGALPLQTQASAASGTALCRGATAPLPFIPEGISWTRSHTQSDAPQQLVAPWA